MERQIEGFSGYLVSTEGDVYSLKRNNKIKLKPGKNCKGYLYVNLCENGKYKSKTIHKLVAKAFIDNPNNLPCVNHIDGIKTNNNRNNLEWCTVRDNSKHAFRLGLIKSLKFGEEHRFSKLKIEDIVEIRRKYESGKITMRLLSKEYGVSLGNIKLIIHRKTWKSV